MEHASRELPPLRKREIVRQALAIYRGQFARVVTAAFIVLFPTGLLENLVNDWLDTVDDNFPIGLLTASFFLSIGTGFAAALGTTAFAGLLDKLVGEELHGHPHLTLWQALASLPFRRLIVADFLLTALVTAGSALLVVPGLVFLTLFALVGPIIIIEERGVFSAFRRSAGLARVQFVTIALIVTLPKVIEEQVEELIHEALHHQHPILIALVLSGVFSATIGAIVGLIEVVLAYELVDRHPASDRPVPSGAGHGH